MARALIIAQVLRYVAVGTGTNFEVNLGSDCKKGAKYLIIFSAIKLCTETGVVESFGEYRPRESMAGAYPAEPGGEPLTYNP
jgi:hypothetical protein